MPPLHPEPREAAESCTLRDLLCTAASAKSQVNGELRKDDFRMGNTFHRLYMMAFPPDQTQFAFAQLLGGVLWSGFTCLIHPDAQASLTTPPPCPDISWWGPAVLGLSTSVSWRAICCVLIVGWLVEGRSWAWKQGLRQPWSLCQRQAEGAAGMTGGAMEASLKPRVVPSGACGSWIVV